MERERGKGTVEEMKEELLLMWKVEERKIGEKRKERERLRNERK